jgi:hypothetical protein
VIGEKVTGKGILQQVGIETGEGLSGTALLLASIMLQECCMSQPCTGSIGMTHHIAHAAGIPVGQTSIFLVAFIGFFLLSAIFTGNYGEDAIDDDKTY